MTTTYHYRARTPEGDRVAGSIVAESADAVISHLRTRALFITAVIHRASFEGNLEALRTVGPISPAPVVTLFRSLATMIRAGVSLTRALEIVIAQCAHRTLGEALRSALADIEAGASLSDALRRHGSIFNSLHVAMVEAGEVGGLLDDVLERISSMLERDRVFRKRLTSALAYPACVLLAASALTLLLVATIVPTFARMFEQLQVPLPFQTRVLVTMGDALHDPLIWAIGLLVVSVLGAVVASARRNIVLSRKLDRALLNVPVVGTIVRKVVTARICRMLGSLLRSGVNLLHAVEIIGPVSKHTSFCEALQAVHAALREGESFAGPLSRSRLFDSMTVQLSRIGEETGTLDRMLLKIADDYDVDVEVAIGTLASLLEPILMIGVGALVGTIVFSIFVPLYSVIAQLR